MLLLALLALDLAIPAFVVEAKYERGRLLLVGQERGSHSVQIRDREGKVLRSVYPSQLMRRRRLFDVALGPAGEIVLAVSSPGTLGPAENRLFVFPLQGAPQSIDIGQVVCHRLAADPQSGFWCLGPELAKLGTGKDYPIVHYFTADGVRAGQYLSRNRFPREGLDGATAPEPSAGGDVGLPQILATAPGRALAWLPMGDVLVTLDQNRHQSVNSPMGVVRRGRSLITIAAASPTGVYALLPELPPGEAEEGFLTPYRLAKKDNGGWSAVPGVEAWPRGTQLIGADSDYLAIWVRPRQRIYFLPLFK